MFSVVSLDQKGCDDACATLRSWKYVAQTRAKQVGREHPAYQKLLACDSVCTSFGANLAKESEFFRAYVSRDAQGQDQAIMSVDEHSACFEVIYLVTNPANIYSPDGKSVRGAGSSLLMHIFQDTLDSSTKKYVVLTPTLSSRRFYANRGFLEDVLGDMHITIERIQKFYPQLLPSIAA